MLDLTCVSKDLIGSFGSMYFVGFAISAFIIPLVADRIGRKKPLIASIGFQSIFWGLLFASHSIYFTIFCFLGVGLAAGGRMTISIIYMNELIPQLH